MENSINNIKNEELFISEKELVARIPYRTYGGPETTGSGDIEWVLGYANKTGLLHTEIGKVQFVEMIDFYYPDDEAGRQYKGKVYLRDPKIYFLIKTPKGNLHKIEIRTINYYIGKLDGLEADPNNPHGFKQTAFDSEDLLVEKLNEITNDNFIREVFENENVLRELKYFIDNDTDVENTPDNNDQLDYGDFLENTWDQKN